VEELPEMSYPDRIAIQEAAETATAKGVTGTAKVSHYNLK